MTSRLNQVPKLEGRGLGDGPGLPLREVTSKSPRVLPELGLLSRLIGGGWPSPCASG